MARERHLHRAGARWSLSWSLRNGVARSRHLDRAGTPSTENFLIKKGGRGRAIWVNTRRLRQLYYADLGHQEDRGCVSRENALTWGARNMASMKLLAVQAIISRALS
ncbi:hypothetical protein PIB30_045878 [Stylosanthes scabra]|uniref:Uncharacterized protein n=1 Tax=Stylosanthes scabra TaxID=79078 RepID=A0ABU6RGL7_9FABA|nr:hypothetical protein [Stylosanthes scabra]